MKPRSRARKAGLPPGTPVHIGERKVDQAKVTLIDFTPDTLDIRPLPSVAETASCRKSSSVSWIDVNGLHDIGLLEKIGENFQIAPLMLEDIANTDQRPKLDAGEEQLFLVVKMLRLAGSANFGESGKLGIDAEQVSFVIGRNYLLTFQEKEGDVFDPVRERIRKSKGRLRRSGPDYLAYALLDLIVDNYFVVLEQLAEEIEGLEEQVLGDPEPATIQRIQQLKHALLLIRRATWPLREMVSSLLRDESSLIKRSTHPFLRDLYDHAIHALDTVESQREMLSGLLEVHISNINNRMGEVMRVLTIIATLFIPLTFVAGLYGMNFEHMPELAWKWGYPLILALMLAVGAGMLVYFRLKKWI